MLYRKLGKTGYSVSQLGFGAMRLPMLGEGENAQVNDDLAVPMIHRAFEAGVNYIDTAVGYCNRDSQRAVGKALKGWRDKIVVSTKNHNYGESEAEWRQNLEDSLRLLDIDSIDIYNHHGLSWEKYREAVEPRIAHWMEKARDEGLIKHICCSTHDNNEGLKKLVDSGYPSVITLQYNMLDRQLEDGIAYAADKGVGVVVMGPVGGGRLGVPSDVLAEAVPATERIPELAMRFVLANPNVSVALSGMSNMEQVEENLRVTSDPAALSEAELEQIRSHLERLESMKDLYCTGCRYCLPCPSGVNIPGIFTQYNLGRVYGLWDAARQRYAAIQRRGQGADRCSECHKCEAKCPQDLAIARELKAAHEALSPHSTS